MSLFKLKSLWTHSYPNQQFDQKHLAIGQIQNYPAIAIASFSGMVCIYTIKAKDPLEIYQIYQNKFQSSIINIQFLSQQQQQNTIGILLFRKLITLTLSYTPSQKTYKPKITSIQCQPSFKIHPQQPFCLLTLNSSIQYINPVSILKIKQSDPIFPYACNYSNNRKSIFYGDGQELVMIRSGVEQWRIVLGEIRQIQYVKKGGKYGKKNMSGKNQEEEEIVVVFGSNNVWEVCNAGINRSKIIDDQLICGAVLNDIKYSGEEFYNLAIANYEMQIMIYTRNYTLLWAIKYDDIPITFKVFKSQSLAGALAILTQDGMLDICYAGTELIQTQLQQLQNTEIDLNQVQQQTQRYLQEIHKNKETTSSTSTTAKNTLTQQPIKLTVRTLIPSVSTQLIESEYKLLQKNGGYWNCKIQCMINVVQAISNVSAMIAMPSNLYCMEPWKKVALIKNKECVVFSLFCSKEKFAYDAVVEVVVKYQVCDRNQSSNFIKQKCRLPADFQCSFKSDQLLQKPQNKIVLSASKQLPLLSKMYPQFQSKLKDSKNMTITLSNGVQCSIGYNKTFTKAKIQSNFFSGLSYLLTSFLTRYKQLHSGSDNKISTQKHPPLEELVTIMKQHYDKREQIKKSSLELEKKCEEFRAAQKKLLLKLKQKMTSSNQIEKLLEYTYNRLMACADYHERLKEDLKIISHNLEIGLKFITELAFIKYEATEVCKERVMGVIGYEEESQGGYGWQEKVINNSAYFLKKSFNYLTDKYSFEQVYKIVNWVLAKVQSGQWNQ